MVCFNWTIIFYSTSSLSRPNDVKGDLKYKHAGKTLKVCNLQVKSPSRYFEDDKKSWSILDDFFVDMLKILNKYL